MNFINSTNYMDKQVVAYAGTGNKIECGKLGDIKNDTEKFFARHLANLMFSNDMERPFSVSILSIGDKMQEVKNIQDVVNNFQDNILLSSRELAREDYIYNAESPSESKLLPTYETKYLDYSYLLRIADVYDIEISLVTVDKENALFSFGWKNKNKFSDIDVATNVDWVPKKKAYK